MGNGSGRVLLNAYALVTERNRVRPKPFTHRIDKYRMQVAAMN